MRRHYCDWPHLWPLSHLLLVDDRWSASTGVCVLFSMLFAAGIVKWLSHKLLNEYEWRVEWRTRLWFTVQSSLWQDVLEEMMTDDPEWSSGENDVLCGDFQMMDGFSAPQWLLMRRWFGLEARRVVVNHPEREAETHTDTEAFIISLILSQKNISSSVSGYGLSTSSPPLLPVLCSCGFEPQEGVTFCPDLVVGGAKTKQPTAFLNKILP